MISKLAIGFLILILLFCACAQQPGGTPMPSTTGTPLTTKAPGPTQESKLLELVGQVGGPTRAVAVQGNYAYVGAGSSLIFLDISDAAAMHEVNSTSQFGGYVQDICISNNLAYIACGDAGIYIAEVAQPSGISVIGKYDTPGCAERIAVTDNYAYIADGWGGFCVADISNTLNPYVVSHMETSGYAFDIAISGNYAYLACAGAGLIVVDVSKPQSLVEVARCDTPGYAYGVELADDSAFVADGWGGVHIIDIAEPTHPYESGSFSTDGWTFDVCFYSKTLYVADGFGGLQVFDMSDKVRPKHTGTYSTAQDVHRVVLDGNIAYVVDLKLGLRAIDISDANQLTEVGAYCPMGYADAVAVTDRDAYVAAATYGLRIIDVSDNSHPVEVGGYDTKSYATSISVVGNYAFIATSPAARQRETRDGLHIVNVSDPTHPFEVAFIKSLGMYRDMCVSDGIAYVANESGLDIIDISNPVYPSRLGSISLQEWPGCATGVAVEGHEAYVAMGPGGLKIVDVTDPRNPKAIASFKYRDMCYAEDVSVSENLVFLADIVQGLVVIDVSHPTAPVCLATYRTDGDQKGVVTVNDRAYVADGNKGVSVIDLAKPEEPKLLGSCSRPGYAHDITVTKNHAYVANGDGGLLIFDLKSSDANKPTAGMLGEPNKIGDFANNHVSAAGVGVAPNMQRIETSSTLAMDSSIRVTAAFVSEEHGSDPPMLSDEKVYAADLVRKLDSYILSILPNSTRTLVVTNAADNGSGSLRWCLENVRSGDTIVFDPNVFPRSNPVSIRLTSGLPDIGQDRITVDASNAGVILDGSGISEFANGLGIGGTGNVVKGLQIINFPSMGIQIMGSYNQIGGTGPGERNVVSSNRQHGISIVQPQACGNLIVGNYIGTDASGEVDMGNTLAGVTVEVGAHGNTLAYNAISGNKWAGVAIGDWGCDYNSVVGNLIGTDATGTRIIGNGGEGVLLCMHGYYNRVGGSSPGERNVISGNQKNGVSICSFIGEGDVIIGNYIGTDVNGTKDMGNRQGGINLQGHDCFVGGLTEGEANVISCNNNYGLALQTSLYGSNWVAGNFIGTDASGEENLGNAQCGIWLHYGSGHNVIQTNLVSNNHEVGILIENGEQNLVFDNAFVANKLNGSDKSGPNAWYFYGKGNYWSDYKGKDNNGDGIGDTPYRISPNGVDHFPLMRP